MKALFGGVVAFLLLVLYTMSVVIAVYVVYREPKTAEAAFTDGDNLAMTTIGALVSSLVISVLASTEPGEVPLRSKLLRAGFVDWQVDWTQYATLAYLAVWLVCGLTSFVVGEMLYPNVLHELTDHGRAWIGLAVSSGYAYFGIKPASGPRDGVN